MESGVFTATSHITTFRVIYQTPLFKVNVKGFYLLTHWLLDYNLSCSLNKRSNANGILSGHSEKEGLSEGEIASNGILPAGTIGQ